MIDKKTNPYVYSVDPELHQIFNSMVDLQTRVATKLENAARIAGFADNLTFKPTAVAKIDIPDWKSIRTRTSTYHNAVLTDLKIVDEYARNAFDVAKLHLDEIEEFNKPIVEYNNNIRKHLTTLMAKLGIQDTYTTYEYSSSRSKTKKSVLHTSGFISDMNRVCPQSNVSTLRYSLENQIKLYSEWLKNEKAAEEKKMIEDDEIAVKKNILGNPHLVESLMLGGVNILNEVNNAMPGKKSKVISYCVALAISNVTSKNKYLKLGHSVVLAIKSDTGKEILEDALNNFTPSDGDVKLVSKLSNIRDTWDQKGSNTIKKELYSDTDCGYNVIMGKADNEAMSRLMEDLRTFKDL